MKLWNNLKCAILFRLATIAEIATGSGIGVAILSLLGVSALALVLYVIIELVF